MSVDDWEPGEVEFFEHLDVLVGDRRGGTDRGDVTSVPARFDACRPHDATDAAVSSEERGVEG